MASKTDLIRMILLSLPALLDSSKDLMQNFKKAKINDEDVQAALNDLLDQKKELEEIRSEVSGLKAHLRTFAWVSATLLMVLIGLVSYIALK
ncbi:MAG: hypothetical protein AAGA85_27955 [Bacteroidota bacterium]